MDTSDIIAELELNTKTVIENTIHCNNEECDNEMSKSTNIKYDNDDKYEMLIDPTIKKVVNMVSVESLLSFEQTDYDRLNKIIKFTCSNKYDYLWNSKLSVKIPNIELKDEYKNTHSIRYTDNLAHHIFNELILAINNKNIGSYNSISLDNIMQLQQTNEMYEQYSKLIGNKEYLINWCKELPEDIIVLPLPFEYNKNIKNAFPLNLLKDNKLQHIIKFENDISKLIQISEIIRDDNDNIIYNIIEPNIDLLNIKNKYIEDIPKLSVIYINIDKDNYDLEKYNKHIYEFHNYVTMCSENPVKFGKSYPPKHLTSETTTLNIYYNARKENALLYNSYSNYTTNMNNIKLGKSPVCKESLRYGNSYKFKNRDSYHSSIINIYNRFNRLPNINGYHCITWEVKPCESNKHGQTLKINQPILELTLGETYPKYKNSEPNKDKYDLFITIEMVDFIVLTKDGITYSDANTTSKYTENK